MILASWNCIAVPIEIGFRPDFSSTLLYSLFDYFIDFNFLIDIFLNFRTSYIRNSTGDEIFDPSLIAIAYMKGRFWVDFLAILPYDLVSFSDENLELIKLFSMLKVIRVLRLGLLIEKLNIKQD